MKLFFSCVLASAILFTSCNPFAQHVKGDGNVTTQTRTVENFHGVDVGGAIELYVTQDAGYSVKVEADNNLQEYIEVYNEGSRLHIHQRNNTSLNPSKDIKVYVSAPAFRNLGASGACKIKTQNRLSSDSDMNIDFSGASEGVIELKAPSVSVDISGASKVELSGETKDVRLGASGSSHIKAFNLMTENAKVELSGASSADLYASVKIDAEISGASEVEYKGNATINSRTSGASSVKKAD